MADNSPSGWLRDDLFIITEKQMKMKIRLTFISTLVFVTYTLLLTAQTSLRILDTEWVDFWGEDGTFEEAVIAIQPQGAYMEVELFLTMSALGTNQYGEELEIVLDFSLPKGSIVHDSWLWLPDETTIVKADVHDIRTATQIYEDIVDRAQDPSLLYRKSDGGYRLRIFPLSFESYRKVKLTYLTPAVWKEDGVESFLPTNMFNHSVVPLSNARIITKPTEGWNNPRLAIGGFGDLFFEAASDPVFGDILAVEIPNEFFQSPVKFKTDAPFNEDGIYADKLTDGEDHFYQVAYMPPDVNHQSEGRKICVLMDHQPDNAFVSKFGLFSHLKEELLDYLGVQDSFNIFFSKAGGNHFLSEQWISGEESVDVLSPLVDPVDNYPDVIEILTDGINFIKSNGGTGDILLIANSNNADYWYSSMLTAQILELIGGDDIRINIVQYQDRNYYFDWWWGGDFIVEYNHKELYENLTFHTSGFLYSSFDGAFNAWESISNAFADLFNEDYFFDFDIEMAGGFAYDQYEQQYMGQSKNAGKAIVQTGRFIGEMPMTVEFIGFGSEGNFVEDSHVIEADQFYAADTLLREIWFGHHIRQLEGEASGNSDEQYIIDLSILERVLSRYTAFLALDIENGGDPCLNCWGYEYITVDTEDEEQSESTLKVVAHPNPFADNCMITLEASDVKDDSEIVAYISDSFGKKIRTIDLAGFIQSGKMQWSWNGMDEKGQRVPDGIYFLTIKTDKELYSMKLMLMK